MRLLNTNIVARVGTLYRFAVAAISFALVAGCNIFVGTTDTRRPYIVVVSPETVALSTVGASATATARVSMLVGVISVVDDTAVVSWTTSNTKVATVTQEGQMTTVTGVGQGSATITATSHGAVGRANVVVGAPASLR